MSPAKLAIALCLATCLVACDEDLSEPAPPMAEAPAAVDPGTDEAATPRAEGEASDPAPAPEVSDEPEPTPQPTEPQPPQPTEPEGPSTPEVTPTPSAPPAPEVEYAGSEPTIWTPQGTTKLPSYGANCRLTTDAIFASESNGYLDDTLLLEADGSGAYLMLEVTDGLDTILSAEVDLARALVGRSFRDAEGEALFGASDGEAASGQVVDGTLCFSEKLPEATGDVLAEFSLIIALEDGGFVSVGGDLWIPGALIDATAAPLVTVEAAGAIDVSLQ